MPARSRPRSRSLHTVSRQSAQCVTWTDGEVEQIVLAGAMERALHVARNTERRSAESVVQGFVKNLQRNYDLQRVHGGRS
jgi:hypothetical protein